MILSQRAYRNQNFKMAINANARSFSQTENHQEIIHTQNTAFMIENGLQDVKILIKKMHKSFENTAYYDYYQRDLFSQTNHIYSLLESYPQEFPIKNSLVSDILNTILCCLRHAERYASDVFKNFFDIINVLLDKFSPIMELHHEKNQIEKILHGFSMRLNSQEMQLFIQQNPISNRGNPIHDVLLKIVALHVRITARHSITRTSGFHASLREYEPILRQYKFKNTTSSSSITENITQLVQDIIDNLIVVANGMVSVATGVTKILNDIMNLTHSAVSNFISMLLSVFNNVGLKLENMHQQTTRPSTIYQHATIPLFSQTQQYQTSSPYFHQTQAISVHHEEPQNLYAILKRSYDFGYNETPETKFLIFNQIFKRVSDTTHPDFYSMMESFISATIQSTPNEEPFLIEMRRIADNALTEECSIAPYIQSKRSKLALHTLNLLS